MNVKLYLKDKTGEYINIPLYGDESIRYQSKISDAEDLETVFNDSTNNFTIPATDEANQVFDYWFELGVNRFRETSNSPGLGTSIGGNPGAISREQVGFDIKKKIDAYIEIYGIPYKYGKVSLTGLDYEDGLPVNYKIEFYGGLIDLSAKLEKDSLSDLSYLDRFDYKFSVENYLNSINQPHLLQDGSILTPPLLITDENINIIENNEGNILSPEGAIRQDNLRPSIKVTTIIKAIEEQYGIKFKSNFLNRSEVQRLFLWLNKNEDDDDLLSWRNLPLDDSFEPVHGLSIGRDRLEYNKSTGVITAIRDMKDLVDARDFADVPLFNGTEIMWSIGFNFIFTLGASTVEEQPIKVRVRDLDTNEIVGETEDWILPTDEVVNFYSSIKLFYDRNRTSVSTHRFVVEYLSSNEIELEVISRLTNYCLFIEETPFQRYDIEGIENDKKTFNLYSRVSVRGNLPDIKVSEFFKGLMDMFRLVIIPLGGNEYSLETIGEYYQQGNTVDLTSYINKDSHNSSVRKVFKRLQFNWKDSDNVLEKNFEREYRRQYGSLEIIDEDLENEKKVELPFTNLMLSPLVLSELNDTVINVGLMQELGDDGTLTKSNKGVVLFYYNGINNLRTNPVYIELFGQVEPFQFVNNIDLVNSDNALNVSNILSWGREFNSNFDTSISTNLFNNYWKGWVDTLYHKDSRIVTYEGVVDYPLIDKLSLNSKVLIGNQAYNINELDIDLTNNKLKVSLFPNFEEISQPYIGAPHPQSVYTVNSAEVFESIPLPSFSDWEVKVDYSQFQGSQVDWIDFICDYGERTLITETDNTFTFSGRLLNLKIHQNISVIIGEPGQGQDVSQPRQARLTFTQVSTGEQYIINLYQQGLDWL